MPPGTPAYRSPEALDFRERFRLDPEAHYQARPADDIYALGVTAYRLVTSTYPSKPWGSGRLLPPSALASVCPELEALMLQMLSEAWEVRGTAGELAQALENAAAGGKRLDAPVRPHASVLPTEVTRFRGEWAWRARMIAQVALCMVGVAAVALLLIMAASKRQQQPDEEELAEATQFSIPEEWHVPPVETPDAGVGEPVLTAAQDFRRVGVSRYALGLPMPKQPLLGQRKPPCDTNFERVINGGCWAGPIGKKKPPCGDKAFDYDDGCYMPSYDMPRQPTSEQP